MINAQGQFVPQQPASQAPFNPQATPQFQTTMAMQTSNPGLINQRTMNLSNPMMLNQQSQMNLSNALNSGRSFMGQPNSQPTSTQPSWVQPAGNQMGQNQNVQQQPMQQQNQFAPPWMNQPMGQFGVPQGMQTQQGQSIEQGVQNNNPQSVQNFMSALNRVGAGSSNGMMNGYGQQGAQAQAGFQGFQSNGMNPQQIQQQYGGQNYQYGGNQGPSFMGPSTIQNGPGQFGNQSSMGQNYNAYNGAGAGYNQQAGAINGQGYGQAPMNSGYVSQPQQGAMPQWQTPAPWGQPGNAAPSNT